MPKTKSDYSKTVIYKIVCNDLNIKDIYVGSTTDFTRRKYNHKSSVSNANSINYNIKLYRFIRNNGGWENWSMIEIEKYPCNDKREAEARERYYYELLNAELNTYYPIRSSKEWVEDNELKLKEYYKDYYNNNKDKIKEFYDINKVEIIDRIKDYYSNNKDKIKAYKKQYRDENKDKIKEQEKKYREQNKDKIKEYKKKYYENKKVLKKKCSLD